MLDVISIGVVTLDTFIKFHDANIKCSLNRESCQFCFNYGDKIAVDQLTKTLGGNGANNAVGNARLGLSSAIYTVYGNDDVGKQIEETFDQEGVSRKYCVVDKSRASDSAYVINFKAERTIFVYHEKRDYKLPKLEPAKWVYLTSLMKGFEKIHKDLLKYLNENQVKLAYNPGTHQLLAGKQSQADILEATEVLIVNKEEAQRLLEDNERDIKALLQGLRRLGAKTAVITDGPRGSYTSDGTSYFRLGILDSPIIERTGTGDSYSSGFVAALINNQDLSNAMVWGTFNAWSVVQKIGPQAGLLHSQEMEKLLKENPGFRPKSF